MLGTKKKLLTAAVMLVLSVIMLTSASFAWFTISTNPEITDMSTQVVTNENLEIALASTAITSIPAAAAAGDTGNQYTWGNVIDLNAGTATTDPQQSYTALNRTLRPATLNGTTHAFQYPTYGEDGRIETNLGSLTEGSMANGFGNLTDDAATPNVYGYYIDFWVRSNVGGVLTLSTAGTARNADGVMGLGSYFLSNAGTSADQALATNIAVAFKDITPNVAGAEAASGAYAVAATHTAGSPALTAGKYKTPFEDSSIITLTANSAKLIRMYVYLEGSNVTNASASIDGTTIGGSLNIQFGIDGVANSMAVSAAAPG